MKKFIIVLILGIICFCSCNNSKPRYCDELVFPNPDEFINIYDKMDINDAVNVIKDTYNLIYINDLESCIIGNNNGKCNFTKDDSLFVCETILIQKYYNDYTKFCGYEISFQSNSVDEINNIYNEILSSYYTSNNFTLYKSNSDEIGFNGKLYNIYFSRINTDIEHNEVIDSNTGNKIVTGYVYPNHPKLDGAIKINAAFNIQIEF